MKFRKNVHTVWALLHLLIFFAPLQKVFLHGLQCWCKMLLCSFFSLRAWCLVQQGVNNTTEDTPPVLLEHPPATPQLERCLSVAILGTRFRPLRLGLVLMPRLRLMHQPTARIKASRRCRSSRTPSSRSSSRNPSWWFRALTWRKVPQESCCGFGAERCSSLSSRCG